VYYKAERRNKRSRNREGTPTPELHEIIAELRSPTLDCECQQRWELLAPSHPRTPVVELATFLSDLTRQREADGDGVRESIRQALRDCGEIWDFLETKDGIQTMCKVAHEFSLLFQ
jgi:hypothetical protein